MWRLIYSIPLWLLYIGLIELPLIGVGSILVPIADACQAYAKDPITGLYHWTWPIMKLYDNPDDGIVDPGYGPFTSMFMKIDYWTAIRNPVDNLKQVPIICCKIKPSKVKFIGSFGDNSAPQDQIEKYDSKVPQWWFCWQGLYSNFYWAFELEGHLMLFWVGWKIKPKDYLGTVEQYRLPRAPAGAQLTKET